MITLHVPKNSKVPDLKSELSTASRIKDSTIKKQTITGLNKIIHYL